MRKTLLHDEGRSCRHASIALATAGMLLSGCAIHPVPLTKAEIAQTAKTDRGELFANQDAVKGPITLDEAMARAVKYNLDNRVKMMEAALAHKQLGVANFDLLPQLTASAGYTDRDQVLASRSVSFDNSGVTTVPPSYSSDKGVGTADLAFSWNVLDFGVSYFRAKEQADHVLVAQQERRKVMLLLTQQVREAYWQEVGAQKLRDRIGPLLAEANSALNDSRKSQSEGLKAPIEALGYQNDLLNIVLQLETIRGQLDRAKPRLASLMNLDPGADYTLATSADLEVPNLAMSMSEMESTALESRPELIEASYTERISLNEAHKALVKLLPGIELNAGTHYDSNSFLTYSSWQDVGAHVVGNLFNVLNLKNIRGLNHAQMDLAHEQHLALTMAVLTQVHVASEDLAAMRRQFDLAKQIDDVDRQIFEHMHNAAQADAQGRLAEVQAATTAMMSELRLYQTYGALESAYGQLLASIGLDPAPGQTPDSDASAARQALASGERQGTEAGQGAVARK